LPHWPEMVEAARRSTDAAHVDGAAAIKRAGSSVAGKADASRPPRRPAARRRCVRRTSDWDARSRSARRDCRQVLSPVRQRSRGGRQIPPAQAPPANSRTRRPPPASPSGSG
jgi:hypothetical protein